MFTAVVVLDVLLLLVLLLMGIQQKTGRAQLQAAPSERTCHAALICAADGEAVRSCPLWKEPSLMSCPRKQPAVAARSQATGKNAGEVPRATAGVTDGKPQLPSPSCYILPPVVATAKHGVCIRSQRCRSLRSSFACWSVVGDTSFMASR